MPKGQKKQLTPEQEAQQKIEKTIDLATTLINAVMGLIDSVDNCDEKKEFLENSNFKLAKAIQNFNKKPRAAKSK